MLPSDRERPSNWRKRSLDVISAARSIEWLALKIVVGVGIVSGAGWVVTDIATLPLAWRIVISFVVTFAIGLVPMMLLIVLPIRRALSAAEAPQVPSPERSNPTTIQSAPAEPHAPDVSVSVPRVTMVTDFDKDVLAGRTLIRADPDYLWSLFDGRTSMQAQQLAEPYIGNWMGLSGPLGDWTQDRFVTFKYGSLTGTKVIILKFPETVDRKRLGMIRTGDSFTVLGQLRSVESGTILLGDCELVERS